MSFFNFLYSDVPLREAADGLRWRLKRSGIFDIRSSFIAFRGSPRVSFPRKSIWCVIGPSWVCFFVWYVAWDKILTCNNLMHQGYTMVGRWRMRRCNGGESVDHLLLHCPLAGVLWRYVFRYFGI